MSFQILPASPSDTYDMATIFWDAFLPDPIVGLMGRNVPIEKLYAYSSRRYERAFAICMLEGVRFFKAVDAGTGYVRFLLRCWLLMGRGFGRAEERC